VNIQPPWSPGKMLVTYVIGPKLACISGINVSCGLCLITLRSNSGRRIAFSGGTWLGNGESAVMVINMLLCYFVWSMWYRRNPTLSLDRWTFFHKAQHGPTNNRRIPDERRNF